MIRINNLWEKRSNDELTSDDYNLISWEFPEEMKPFTGEMPFGLRMGMSKEDVEDIFGSLPPDQMEPSRYEYWDLFSLGEESTITMRINEEDGLHYLAFELATPDAVVNMHRTYRDNAMEAIRAGIEASIFWQGLETQKVMDAMVAFIDESILPTDLTADVMNTDLIDHNDNRWRAVWCEPYPEFLMPRFEQIRDWIVGASMDEIDYEGEIDVIDQGDPVNAIFWRREDADTFPHIRLSIDKEKGHITLEALFGWEPVLAEVVCE